MVKYVVTGSKVVFGTGLVLGLSDEQAKIRSLQLKKFGKNYQVLTNVEFKKGEIIDIVTKNLTKATLGQLELAEPQEKAAPPKGISIPTKPVAQTKLITEKTPPKKAETKENGKKDDKKDV
uniref:Uncharacterized protein n=1 Tax=uncultured Alphaproteobacteria bacterium TaxID=91750 RepID=A0A6G8F2H9_9PROT|nr:hypothetical protein PlAlph_3450 [uncultured Alphaproteobacteria bacterium]